MEWVLIDTETTGFSKPIHCLEIAAQRMRDWMPYGPPFRRLINHGCPIPEDATRIHGLTQEMLAREGQSPYEVYQDFSVYVGDLPMASYNLYYDWNRVLLPEWQRIGIRPIGRPGFCVLTLAQKLLRPSPAGNHKLQNLRQHFKLTDRGDHTALGDVYTVIDLMYSVLRPLAERKRLSFTQAAAVAVHDSWRSASPVFAGSVMGNLWETRRAGADLFAHAVKPVLSASDNRLLSSVPHSKVFRRVRQKDGSLEHCLQAF